MSLNMKSILHKIEIVAAVLLILVLVSVWLYNRKLPFAENQVFTMQSHVFWSGENDTVV